MKGVVLDDVGLLLDASDTVATAICDLEAGRSISLADDPRVDERDAETVTLREDVPFGHKFALVEMEATDSVVKYGEQIGQATTTIVTGEWVHTHNCESVRGRGDLAGARTETPEGR